ncbi:hypothetical protein GCM10027347_50100 [Larkinella harenae]
MINAPIFKVKAARPAAFYLLIVLLVVLGVGGIQGGGQLILDPSGRTLGVSSSILTDLPGGSFLGPGLFIVSMFGLAPFYLAYCLWVKLKSPMAEQVLKGCGYHWAWAASVGLGVLLLLWTGAIVWLIGYRILYQAIDGLMALVLLNLLSLPSIRLYMIES